MKDLARVETKGFQLLNFPTSKSLLVFPQRCQFPAGFLGGGKSASAFFQISSNWVYLFVAAALSSMAWAWEIPTRAWASW